MTVRLKWNMSGFRDIRYSRGAQALCEEHGRRVLQRANSSLKLSGPTDAGFVMSSRAGARRPKGRWRVTVAATSPHAKRKNARDNTLVKALG